MRILSAMLLCALRTVCMLAPVASGAGEIRASFLQNTNCLRETAEFLTQSGCARQGTAAFEHAVRQYFQEPFDFDFANFPEPTRGFYSFPSPRKLVTALPHRLPETQHTYDLNCMDAVILLADGQLRTRLRPDDIVGPIMAPIQTTNGEAVALTATPRDAFTLSYPAWYLEATESLIPKPMRDSRVCLVASLFRWHMLPSSTTKDNAGSRVLDVLRATWQREKVKFPARFDLVLLHNVSINGHTVSTCHAGLLFHRNTGYTYIEKAGACGPFVRLDFVERSDLLPWLATAFTNYTDANFSKFATFNDQSIKQLNCQ